VLKFGTLQMVNALLHSQVIKEKSVLLNGLMKNGMINSFFIHSFFFLQKGLSLLEMIT